MSLNPYDDKTYSGYQGSQTPLAVENQQGLQQPKAASTPPAAGSPYEAILSHVIGSASQGAAAASMPAVAQASSAIDTNGDAGGPSGPTNPSAPTASLETRGRASTPPPVYSATNPPPHPGDASMADANIAADYYRKFSYINPSFANISAADVEAYRVNPLGMTIGDWYLAGHRAPAQAGVDPNGNPIPVPTTGGGGGGVSTGGGGGGSISPTVTPGAPSPIPKGQTGGSQPGSSDWQSILAQLQKMMNPQFDYESGQLNRHLNAQAALTGDLNSGGYGEVSGRANAQLSADQGNRLSTMLNTDWQNQLARELQKYGIDIGSADSRYSADRGVDAAGLHASAASAAAGMGLQGTLAGLAQQETESKRQWDEYWGNLGLGARGQDYDFLGRLLSGMGQYSPESLNGQALGGPFPGYSYFPAVDWTKYFSSGKP